MAIISEGQGFPLRWRDVAREFFLWPRQAWALFGW